MKITYQLDKQDLINVLARVYSVEPEDVTLGTKTQFDPNKQFHVPYAEIIYKTDINVRKQK